MGSSEHGVAAGTLDVEATIELYTMIGVVSAGIGLFILVITPLLKKGMHGVH